MTEASVAAAPAAAGAAPMANAANTGGVGVPQQVTTESGSGTVVNGQLQQTNVPVQPGANGQGQWWDGFESPEAKGFAQLRNWKSAEDAVKSFQNVEKLVGRDTVALPKDINDNDARNVIFDKLGRPKSPADYQYKPPEGKNDSYFKAMTGVMHKHGLTQEGANDFIKASNDFAQQVTQQAEAQFKQKATQEFAAKRAEWGPNADKYQAAVQRANAAFGIDKGTFVQMERAMGTGKVMDLMASIGLAIGEDGFDGTAETTQFRSPEAARAKLAELKADKEWGKRYLEGGLKERQEFQRLSEYIAQA